MIDVEIAGLALAIFEKFAEPTIEKRKGKALDAWEKFKINSEKAFNQYLSNVYEKYHKIKTLLYRTEPKDLYDFFLPPRLCRNDIEFFKADSIESVTSISNFVIISGTAGIGKSTLMKHLFISTLKNKFRIPVFFELKDINDSKGEFDIKVMIFRIIQNLGVEFEEKYMEHALRSGCFIFLFDGYDEIVSNYKEIFHKKLDEFCDRYSKNYFVVSSRPYGDFIDFQRFYVVSTVPLNKKESIELIGKIQFDIQIKEKFMTALKEELYDKHESFATNPLLLNMMLLTYENYAEIPSKLHAFYSSVFDTLFSKHDATKAGFKREMKSNISQYEFKKVFSYFSYVTYVKGIDEFDKETFYEELRNIQKLFVLENKTLSELNLEKFIFDLINSVCLIQKVGLKFKYTHRSFQEYFVAVFLKELPDTNLMNISLNMIKKDPKRVLGDNIFFMLYDMTCSRIEKNVILPMIEIFEEKYEPSTEKYLFYLDNLIDEIWFHQYITEKDDRRYKLNLNVKISYEKNKVLHQQIGFFLERFALINRVLQPDNNVRIDEVYEYALNNNLGTMGTGDHLIVSGEEFDLNKSMRIAKNVFFNDHTLMTYLKETWFHDQIEYLVSLKDNLENKPKDFENNLFDLFFEEDSST